MEIKKTISVKKFKRFKERNTEKIKRIIVHCSDYEGEHNIFSVHKWHLMNGWAGCGYHFFITKYGHVQRGRKLNWVGCHTRGFNRNSIGICLEGKQRFSKAQAETLMKLIDFLKRMYGIKKVNGHRFYSPLKTCPNFSVKQFLETGEIVFSKSRIYQSRS